MIIHKFGDLNRRIYLYGTSKKLDLKEEDEIVPSKLVILPDSKFKIMWNIIMVILLLYTATFVPYRTAFIDEAP